MACFRDRMNDAPIDKLTARIARQKSDIMLGERDLKTMLEVLAERTISVVEVK